MKKIGSKIVMVLAFLIAFGAVKYGMKEYRQHTNENSTQDLMQKVDAKFQQAIVNDTSDRSDTEKVYDASHSMVSDRLKNAEGGNVSLADREFSAGVFAGQYGRITSLTPDYCRTLGVDVSAFASVYKNMHKSEYVRAEALLNKAGSSIKEVYTTAAPVALKYVKKEVADIRLMMINETGNNEIELADACGYYNLIAEDSEIMESISFRAAAPDAYKVLMN